MNVFVFTGVATIGGMHVKRDHLKKVVETFGHKFGTSISRADAFRTVLVTDTPHSNTLKNAAADQLGVEKITSDKFLGRMINQGLTTDRLAQILMS